MKLTRRELVPLSLSIAAACASPMPYARAQQSGRPPPSSGRSAAMASLPPVPRPQRPGDLGGLLIVGMGDPAGTVATLSQAFAPGELPRSARLTARLADSGTPLESSLRVLARHPDGSVKVALLAIAQPALRVGMPAGIVLARLPV
jgi:hypothetical protein